MRCMLAIMGDVGTACRFRCLCSVAFAALLLQILLSNGAVVAAVNEDSITASWCPDAFYNFGDSMSDTGNGIYFDPELKHGRHYPYGEAFFGRPTGRFSNGRLALDFILLSFQRRLLKPLWKAGAAERTGVNFAFAGATGARIAGSSSCMADQLQQFLGWKAEAEEASYLAGGVLNQSKKLDISSALFIIDVGGNDLLYSALLGYSYDDLFVIAGPALLKAITTTVKALYFEGARKFLIPNVPAEGCSPSSFTFMVGYGIELDDLGCLDVINAFNRVVNDGMHEAVREMRVAMPDATFIYFDRFSVNLEVLRNPTKYGFDPDVVPIVCCGAPGVGIYNLNMSNFCGDSGFTVCKDPEQYVNWDGIHFTEHYYRVLAEYLLTGVYSDPPTNLTDVCNLSYENFGPEATYESVFLSNSGSRSSI